MLNTFDNRAMKDGMMGLVGDSVQEIPATKLHTKFNNQLDRIGKYAASWSRFVDVARDCGVQFTDASDGGWTAHLPKA